MKTAYIGLGSNLGDSLRDLRDAWRKLGEQPEIRLTVLSSPYRTEPVGMNSPNWFINAVGCLQTSAAPLDLLHRLTEIEKRLGRTRRTDKQGYHDRILDLDLLLYDQLILKTDDLTLPHPEMHRRRFVLEPLCEIAPNCLHPRLQKTVDQLFQSLTAIKSPVVQKISWNDHDKP